MTLHHQKMKQSFPHFSVGPSDNNQAGVYELFKVQFGIDAANQFFDYNDNNDNGDGGSMCSVQVV